MTSGKDWILVFSGVFSVFGVFNVFYFIFHHGSPCSAAPVPWTGRELPRETFGGFSQTRLPVTPLRRLSVLVSVRWPEHSHESTAVWGGPSRELWHICGVGAGFMRICTDRKTSRWRHQLHSQPSAQPSTTPLWGTTFVVIVTNLILSSCSAVFPSLSCVYKFLCFSPWLSGLVWWLCFSTSHCLDYLWITEDCTELSSSLLVWLSLPTVTNTVYQITKICQSQAAFTQSEINTNIWKMHKTIQNTQATQK